jgi:hypothetical protein
VWLRLARASIFLPALRAGADVLNGALKSESFVGNLAIQDRLVEEQGEHELGRIDSKVVEPTELTQATG